MRGFKKQKRCSQKCQDFTLSIRPISKDAVLRQDVHMQFCPHQLPPEYASTKDGLNEDNYYPQFNNDGKAHTPAFVLGIDKKQYIENDRSLLVDHNKKICEYLDSRSQILFPKPSRKHKICSVCRCTYEDYMQHIASESHKRNISSNKFNNEILGLCMTLFNNHNKVEIVVDSDELQTTAQTNRIQSQSLGEFQPPKTKRRKYDVMGSLPALPPALPIPQYFPLPMHPYMMGQWQMHIHQQQQQQQQQQHLAYYYGQQFGTYGNPMMPAYYYPSVMVPGVAGNPIVLD